MITQKPNDFYDGTRIDDIDQSILKHLDNFKNDKSIDFVGLMWVDNKINVFWPKGFKKNLQEITLEDYKKKLICLLNVLRKFSRDNSVYSFTNGKKKYATYPIEMDIIEDYFKNGIYENKEFKSKKSSEGKINWKKTISQSTFYLSKKCASLS